jgi:hypothetical protein
MSGSEHWKIGLVPPPIIIMTNDGPKLVETNYWQTSNAKVGLYYLSTNAGCSRLLVPPSEAHPAKIADMTRNVREVVLTRGAWQGVADCVEVMFEDGSQSPFCLHLDPKQVDRRWLPSNEGKRWRFAIYTELGKVADFSRCFLRSRATLPCVEPWGGR